MKFDNLLRYALRIIAAYAGEKPLHIWLKDFYRVNPQMGSRDRKLASEMVYCFYRLGHSAGIDSARDRILSGLFLCNEAPLELLAYFHPEWNEAIGIPLNEKLKKVQEKFPDFSPGKIFSWHGLLSQSVDCDAFCSSFLMKPDLFIRVRPGKEKQVHAKLSATQTMFRECRNSNQLLFDAYAFANGTRLEQILELNRDAVIQDLSSQKTAILMKTENDPEKKIRAWDCCAASGGKAILLADIYPRLDLTASDIRRSILVNLRLRLAEAGVSPYHPFQADLTLGKDIPQESFDLIVADLPCTGSGTWSRTPESVFFFDPGVIEQYRDRQQKILLNIIPCLKPGGMLVYITCSVFAMENEEMLKFIEASGALRLVRQEMFAGYRERADSMFAASFKKE